MFVLPRSAPPDQSVSDVSTRTVVDLLFTRPAVAITVVIATLVVTRIARGVLRRVVRRVADRNGVQPELSLWRVRVRRVLGESVELAEKRRRQRVDAISRMAGHLFSLIAWLTAAIVVLHVLRVDLVPVLTSAGFIGAGLAIGGQHAVKDFIAGVGILVEDRFGVGDRIVVESATGKEVEGVVQYVGAFSTRISAAESTLHMSNGSLGQVRNLSQTPATASLRVQVPAEIAGDVVAIGDDSATVDAADAVALALSQAAGDRRLTGLVLVDDVKAAVRTSNDGRASVDVEVRTAQPLTGAQANRLHLVATDALWRAKDAADAGR
jgi:small-conductance mechanosensitive channel